MFSFFVFFLPLTSLWFSIWVISIEYLHSYWLFSWLHLVCRWTLQRRSSPLLWMLRISNISIWLFLIVSISAEIICLILPVFTFFMKTFNYSLWLFNFLTWKFQDFCPIWILISWLICFFRLWFFLSFYMHHSFLGDARHVVQDHQHWCISFLCLEMNTPFFPVGF